MPGKPITVAYSYGPKIAKTGKTPMLQCPVSAIPDEVWGLLGLWWQCHMTHSLPLAGGFLDQPVMVRRAFPMFEGEWRIVEAQRAASGSSSAAAAAVAGMIGALGGGR